MHREVTPDKLGDALIVKLVVSELSLPSPRKVTGLVFPESTIDRFLYADCSRNIVAGGQVLPVPIFQPPCQLLPVVLHIEMLALRLTASLRAWVKAATRSNEAVFTRCEAIKLRNDGNANVANIPPIAMAIINSVSVKPLHFGRMKILVFAI